MMNMAVGQSLCAILLVLLYVVPESSCAQPRVFTIGGIVSSKETQQVLKEAVDKANQEHLLPQGYRFNVTSIETQANPFAVSFDICNKLIPNQVYVVIVSHPAEKILSPMAASYTCGFYQIPILAITARDSAFSDKSIHQSFMRTVPPYSDQALLWAKMVEYFKWSKVLFLHSADQEGRSMLTKFASQAELKEITIEKSVQFVTGMSNYTDELMEITTAQSRIILLYATEEDAEVIYKDAMMLNLTDTGYAWIVTEQALNPSNTPPGVLGLKLANSTNEMAHIHDAVQIIGQAFKTMITRNVEIQEAPKACDDVVPKWNGPDIIKYMKAEKIDHGFTGQVAFNNRGDRLTALYDVVNYQNDELVSIGTIGGNPLDNKRLQLNDNAILWPVESTTKPKGMKISSHLRVVTKMEVPFIYKKPMPPSGICTSDKPDDNIIPCPKPNTTGGKPEEFCCYGYCIDLLVHLAKTVNFTYDIHLVEDDKFGSYENVNGTLEWTGMIGELFAEKADMIVAPLTINPERAEVIDFTKPFKYQGLTILVKKKTQNSSLASFLQPFQDTLWILVGLSVHVVALVLYLLDRFSPFGRFKLAKSDDTEEDALNLSSAMWFAWGVLLNSGIGEGTPRSFSARVLGMVWAGFAMIIVASYTANLAAFLVLDRPEASISGIDDARLRNPQDNFKYATIKQSAVSMYFKRQVELSTMYRTMDTRNRDTVEEAIADIKAEELHAFIWDSSRLEFEAAKDCKLVTAGELFGRSGYGIGLPKHSPWTREVSLTVLNLHETGHMERLDNKWILVKDTNCPEKESSPATLGLTNMAGVFMMVAGGIVAGVFLIFIEIAYKRHRGLKEKELELAKTAADRWRGNIEKRRTLRRTLLQRQQEQKANGNTDSPALPNKTSSPRSFAADQPGGTQGPSGYQRVATSVKTNPVYNPGDHSDDNTV